MVKNFKQKLAFVVFFAVALGTTGNYFVAGDQCQNVTSSDQLLHKQNVLDDQATRMAKREVEIFECLPNVMSYEFEMPRHSLPEYATVQFSNKVILFGQRYYEVKTKEYKTKKRKGMIIREFLVKADDIQEKFYSVQEDSLSDEEIVKKREESKQDFAGISEEESKLLKLYTFDGYTIFNDYLRKGLRKNEDDESEDVSYNANDFEEYDENDLRAESPVDSFEPSSSELTNENLPVKTSQLKDIVYKHETCWSKDVVLYRGMPEKDLPNLKTNKKNGKKPHVGEILLDKGFLSTSMSKKVAKNFMPFVDENPEKEDSNLLTKMTEAFMSKDKEKEDHGVLLMIHVSKGEKLGALIDSQSSFSSENKGEYGNESEEEVLLPPSVPFVVIGVGEEKGAKVVHLKSLSSLGKRERSLIA